MVFRNRDARQLWGEANLIWTSASNAENYQVESELREWAITKLSKSIATAKNSQEREKAIKLTESKMYNWKAVIHDHEGDYETAHKMIMKSRKYAEIGDNDPDNLNWIEAYIDELQGKQALFKIDSDIDDFIQALSFFKEASKKYAESKSYRNHNYLEGICLLLECYINKKTLNYNTICDFQNRTQIDLISLARASHIDLSKRSKIKQNTILRNLEDVYVNSLKDYVKNNTISFEKWMNEKRKELRNLDNRMNDTPYVNAHLERCLIDFSKIGVEIPKEIRDLLVIETLSKHNTSSENESNLLKIFLLLNENRVNNLFNNIIPQYKQELQKQLQ